MSPVASSICSACRRRTTQKTGPLHTDISRVFCPVSTFHRRALPITTPAASSAESSEKQTAMTIPPWSSDHLRAPECASHTCAVAASRVACALARFEVRTAGPLTRACPGEASWGADTSSANTIELHRRAPAPACQYPRWRPTSCTRSGRRRSRRPRRNPFEKATLPWSPSTWQRCPTCRRTVTRKDRVGS